MKSPQFTLILFFFFLIAFLTSLFQTTLADPILGGNGTNGTHLECVSQACLPVQDTLGGRNVNLCLRDIDCFNTSQTVRAVRTTFSHLDCVGQACIPVQGIGVDLCRNNTDCQNRTQSHLECINRACIPVLGAGRDLCTTNRECINQTNMTHLVCVNRACISVNGMGENLCKNNADCINGPSPSNQGNENTRNDATVSVEPVLPLAPPPQTPLPQPRTIFGYFLRWIGLAIL